ncbi:MAG: sialate O-acetylesterase, partial [Phycisphaerae bacterium]
MIPVLPTLFSDHAVLQHGQPLPVWGEAPAGSTVRVTLAGASASAQADSTGRFRVTLPPLPPGGPHELVVAAGAHRLTRSDILLGDVWVCAGQSNMEWTMTAASDAKEDLAAATHDAIRLCGVPNVLPAQPTPGWDRCTPASAASASAVGYALGRELHQATGIPIGIISCAWGGTIIDAWTRAQTLANDQPGRAVLAAYAARANSPEARAATATWQPCLDRPAWEQKNRAVDPGDTGSPRGWATLDFDDSAWPTMPIPSMWQEHGLQFSAVIWFRRIVEIPPAWQGRDLILHLGACDKHDTTFVNGENVGAMGFENPDAWSTPRVYRIPGRLVRSGRLVIAARVFSFLYNGGMTGPAKLMRIELATGADNPIPLAGKWHYQIEHNFGFIEGPPPAPPGPLDPNRPSSLWEGKIAPLIPFAIAGFAWYQGESDASEAKLYRYKFRRLIRDWRQAWGWTVPFAFVQLASFDSKLDGPTGSPWAELREAQAQALAEPDTVMATALDLGEPNNIHPAGKMELGRRLAAGILHQSGRLATDPRGPRFQQCVPGPGCLRLSFASGAGLELRGTDSFTIAGEQMDEARNAHRTGRIR